MKNAIFENVSAAVGPFVAGVMNALEKQDKRTEITTAAEVFAKTFDAVKEIEFNPEWANGTGYFDHAVRGKHAPKLEHGEIVRSQTGGKHSRKILIVGTPLNNVVVFERYTDRKDIFAICCSLMFRLLYAQGFDRPMSVENMLVVFGEVDNATNLPNIGTALVNTDSEEIKEAIFNWHVKCKIDDANGVED